MDRLHADIETLQDYATAAGTRASHIKAVREAIEGVYLGTEMLGIVNTSFVNGAISDQQAVVTALNGAHSAVSRDMDAAAASASDLAATEETNTNQFTATELP